MNTKFAALALLGTLALVAAAPSAQAADNGIYLGAGLTHTDFKLTVDGINDSETLDDSKFKVFVGFRPLDWLAIEANYMDLGSATFNDGSGVSIDSKALPASVLFIKEFQIVDLYAKVGAAKWDSDFNLSGVGSVSDNGYEPLFGAGVGLHFGSFGTRLEYEDIKTEGLDNAVNNHMKVLSLSVLWTFL